MSTKAIAPVVTLWAALLLAGCAAGPFDAYQASAQIQSQTLQLDGEQVLIEPDQIACAERAGLLVVLPLGGGRSAGQFKDVGRELGFSDDIHIGDPDYPLPYTQIRGKFPLLPNNIVLNDVDQNTKTVEAKVDVRIDHKCFQKPLRLMGVYKGRFSPSANPTFEFRRYGEDTWKLAGLQH